MDTQTELPLDGANAATQTAAGLPKTYRMEAQVELQDGEVPSDDTTATDGPPSEASGTETDAAVDAVSAAIPPPPPAPPSLIPEGAVHLKEFCDNKGAPDFHRIEAALATGRQSDNAVSFLNNIVGKYPEVNAAILRAMKQDGVVLTPDQEAQITPPAPKKTYEQLTIEFNEVYTRVLQQKGQVAAQAAANQFWHEQVTQPAMEAAAQKQFQQLTAVERQRQEAAAKAANQQKISVELNRQCEEANKAFPKLVVRDAKATGGWKIADPAVDQEMQRQGFGNGRLTLNERVQFALIALKRLRPEQAGKPAVRSANVVAMPAGVARPKAAKNEYQMEVQREI